MLKVISPANTGLRLKVPATQRPLTRLFYFKDQLWLSGATSFWLQVKQKWNDLSQEITKSRTWLQKVAKSHWWSSSAHLRYRLWSIARKTCWLKGNAREKKWTQQPFPCEWVSLVYLRNEELQSRRIGRHESVCGVVQCHLRVFSAAATRGLLLQPQLPSCEPGIKKYAAVIHSINLCLLWENIFIHTPEREKLSAPYFNHGQQI